MNQSITLVMLLQQISYSEGSDITLISDNNAYNMKALAQEAL